MGMLIYHCPASPSLKKRENKFSNNFVKPIIGLENLGDALQFEGTVRNRDS